jgi:hypothetical protein
MASYSLGQEPARDKFRTEIGRLLGQRHVASAPPMSDLAEVIKKMEQSESRSPTGFQAIGYPMSKPDEYRANAQECQRMAGISRNPNERVVWQEMAEHWRSMIPKAEYPKSNQFGAMRQSAQTKAEK